MYLTMGKLTNESGMLLDSTLWGSHQSTSSLPSSRGNQPPLPPPNCWAPPMGFCLHIQIAWMRLQSVWRFPTRNTIWGHGAPQFTGWLIKKKHHLRSPGPSILPGHVEPRDASRLHRAVEILVLRARSRSSSIWVQDGTSIMSLS